MPLDTGVIIAGAGPTGLALACDLARRNVPFRIIDKGTAYFAGSRGKGLQPRSLEVLDDLGVIYQILAHGRFHLPFRAYDGTTVLGDRDIHEGRVPTPDVPYASSLIIAQWRVEENLRARLEALGHRVELNAELTGIYQNADGVIATIADNGVTTQLTTAYLVGADGGHSFVRHALNIGFEGETWPTERMYVGDVKVDNLDRDHWHIWQSKTQGFVGLCPLPSTNSFQFQAQIGPDEEGPPTLECFQRIIDERAGAMNLRLYEATWTSLFRANVRMVDRYRADRVFLAGDAAHVHSPAGGQGMNTGIQDAYNLGWKLALALGGAPDWLLDTYEAERLPVAARMLGITSKLHRELTPKENPGVQQRDAEFLQLGINYRAGRLAQDMRAQRDGLRAGDRAPDSPHQLGEGSTVRLFDLFRGPHFTLLGFGAATAGALQLTASNFGTMVHTHVVTAADEYAYRVYGITAPTQMLIRPDGYIGIATERTSPEEVHSYLRSLTTQSSSGHS